MSFNEELVKLAVSKFAEKQKLQYYDINYHNLFENTKNYFGVLVPITLTGKTQDEEVKYNLIVKVPPNNKILRDIGILEILYTIEITVYTAVIPLYKKYSKFDTSELFPECYYSDSTQNNEVLVMKDMCSVGFKRYEDKFLDLDHVIVSLKSLAQLHALSMILHINMNTENWHSMIPYSSSYPPELIRTSKYCIKNSFDMFKNTEKEKYFKMLNTDFDIIVNKNVFNVKRLIFGHGDYWKENILYKYEGNTPIKACILDHQTTRLLCPAQDYLCLLLTSIEAKTRRKYNELFISTYYDCLKQTLEEHCLDVEDIYSKSDFYHDLKLVAPYCLIITNMSFLLWFGLETDAIIKDKTVLDEEIEKNSTINLYKLLITDIIDDLVAFGYM